MKKIKFSRAIGTLMAVVTLATCLSANPVFAAEVDEVKVIEQQAETESSITPYGGVENLPLGWYTISSQFSISGYNYTPCKTVKGRYLKLDFDSYVADRGGGIVALIEIRDYNTGQFIDNQYHFFTITKEHNEVFTPHVTTKTFDLGYAGRKIQIYTKLVSMNDVDNFERTATFKNYKSYVSN